MQIFDKTKIDELKNDYQLELLLVSTIYFPAFLILIGYWFIGVVGILLAVICFYRLPAFREFRNRIDGFSRFYILIFLIINGTALLKFAFEGNLFIFNIGLAVVVAASIANYFLIVRKVKIYAKTKVRS